MHGQTEFPPVLFKGSVQPVPLGFWHKTLGNTQEMLLGEKELRRDMKFKAFVFQMWLLSCRGCCGSAVSSPNLLGCLKGCAYAQVGILDVDLCGPSIPRMLRVQDSAVHQCDSGWVPVFVGQDKAIALMSIGFLLERPDDAVVWRGPKKNGNTGVCCCWNLLGTLLEGLFLGGTKLLLHKDGLKSLRWGECSACCADRRSCPLSPGPCPVAPQPPAETRGGLGFLSASFISIALIKQFVTDVAWGDLDFLIVDTPPGTSDEHISTVEALRPHQLLGAILVTTPQVGHGMECLAGSTFGGGKMHPRAGLFYTSALQPQSAWPEGSPIAAVLPPIPGRVRGGCEAGADVL